MFSRILSDTIVSPRSFRKEPGACSTLSYFVAETEEATVVEEAPVVEEDAAATDSVAVEVTDSVAVEAAPAE